MLERKNILIIDDDRALRITLAAALEADGGFRATTADTLTDAAAKLTVRDSAFDAIILDLDMPDGHGRDFCARMRRMGVRVPMLILSGATDEHDVVRGLEAGANDYVAKPFRMAELVARLRAQIRAFESSEDAVLTIGPYHFRPSARTLHEPTLNTRVRLTEKEAAVLKYLYRCNGTPVGRQTLLREVWGYASGASTHTVETHIYRLRRKIEPDPTSVRIVVNEEGGYRLAQGRTPSVTLTTRPRPSLMMAMSAA